MGSVLRDSVCVDGAWFRRGQSREQVGAAAALIGDHAWVEDGGAGPAGPPPPSAASVAVSQPVQPVQQPVVEDAGGDASDVVGSAADVSSPVEAAEAPAVAVEPAEVEVESAVSGPAASETVGDADVPGPPPHRGKGSTEAAWRAYAERLGVDVSDAESRAEVIEDIEAAGKPV